jgi:hypothetical protein
MAGKQQGRLLSSKAIEMMKLGDKDKVVLVKTAVCEFSAVQQV